MPVDRTNALSTDEGAAIVANGATAELGGIDILVNNSGVYFERGWWGTTPTEWADIYSQNVVSFVRMIQQVGPRMRDAGCTTAIN